MRPILISNDFLPQVGGIQQYSDNIARRLTDACAFVAAHDGAARTDSGLPYPVRRSRFGYMLPTPPVVREMRAAINDFGADVALFMAPWPLTPIGPRAGIPWAVCTHGAELVIPARLPGPARALLRAALRRAGLLFAVSEWTGRHLRALVGGAGPPIRLLRTGVPLDIFRPGIDASAIRERHGLGDDPVALLVGRLVARKGQDALVEAWPAVLARIPKARLVLVGDGPLRENLEDMAAAGDLPSGSVVFAGRVPWEELPSYYNAADVFACPNRTRWMGLEQEGFGVIFLEAQACGLPVIAGRSGGAPEALIENETGLLVDGSSRAQVAGAIIDLLDDRERARAMGAAGRRFVEANFDWDVIVARLESDLALLATGSAPDSEL